MRSAQIWWRLWHVTGLFTRPLLEQDEIHLLEMFMTGLSSAESVELRVICPNCCAAPQYLLATLMKMDSLPCKECDGEIDLKSGENRLKLQKLSEACASIDAAIGTDALAI